MKTALLNEASLARARRDTYYNFAELAAHEADGLDWTRELRRAPDSDLAHIAIHGGGIEVGTTEAADAAAGDSHNYYSFRGKKKASSNRDLHITSSRFDEPRCAALQRDMVRTVSWHGFHGTDKVTEIGGLDQDFKQWVKRSLLHAGFTVIDAAFERSGSNPQNVCNQNFSGRGVQLELSTAQRAAFFRNGDLSATNRPNITAEFSDYIEAIQLAYRRLRA